MTSFDAVPPCRYCGEPDDEDAGVETHLPGCWLRLIVESDIASDEAGHDVPFAHHVRLATKDCGECHGTGRVPVARIWIAAVGGQRNYGEWMQATPAPPRNATKPCYCTRPA